MLLTEILKLKKPDLTDYVLISDLNENMDAIDSELGRFVGSVAVTPEKDTRLANIKAINEPVEIPANVNINAYINAGYFYQNTDATVTTLVNRATDKPFFMIVYKGVSVGQLWIDYATGKLYNRTFHRNVWSKWVEVATQDDVRALVSESLDNFTEFVHPETHPASMITTDRDRRFVTDTEKIKWNGYADIKNPIEIPKSANLDSYKTAGWYRCSQTATAISIANTPMNRAFSLEVIKGSQVRQIWREYGASGDEVITYERDYNDSAAWGNWKQIAYKGQMSASDVGLDKVTNDKQAKESDLLAHRRALMPHEAQRVDKTWYRWGFKSENGSLIYMEEDI